MKIDQAGYDQKAASIDDLSPPVGKIASDRFDPAIAKNDIGNFAPSAGRVDDTPTL